MGYSQEDWPQLRDDLLAMAQAEIAKPGAASPYGQKYELRATLIGPTGRAAAIVAVWIVLTDEDFPRFVTAFPA